MPEISIVMPTYNQGRFIGAAIDSFLNQTFDRFQLIIVNDGSTDNTEEIVAPYITLSESCYLPRIQYSKKENGGTGSALNEGFKQSTGKYETWMASDNKLYPQALQKMYGFLETHPDVDYVYCNCDIGVMDHTGLVESKRKNLKDEISQEWRPEDLYKHYFLGIVWLWRRELREKVGEFQMEPCEDFDMVLRMVEAGGRFAFLDECLGWFRRHGENMSNKIRKEMESGCGPNYARFVIDKSKKRRRLL